MCRRSVISRSSMTLAYRLSGRKVDKQSGLIDPVTATDLRFLTDRDVEERTSTTSKYKLPKLSTRRSPALIPPIVYPLDKVTVLVACGVIPSASVKMPTAL
ncbi:hypothetical protein D3C75_1048540 [compost metagenome]